ncbi:hypothetical protein HID58_081182 [Brassica napus]|uniref:Cupin type-1 domain-containing protein n=2 Tax=Brassica napus TaxID=3708 RepID=A0ABQ7Y718_BRANA|nr:hypothetical protein HID58_081182 [Brassica napus]
MEQTLDLTQGLLAVVSRKFTRTLHTQDTFVKSSTEVVGAVLKNALGGGSKKNTPPSPQSQSPPSYVNRGALVDQSHRGPQRFPCFFPVSSPTRFVPTTTPDVEPKFPEVVFSGDGGRSLLWKMAVSDVGASKIELLQNGFAPPFFSNGSKIAIVVSGVGTAGLVMEKNGNMEEIVLQVRPGDAIAIPEGIVSWWFNSSPRNFVILFIRHTDKGQCFKDFHLAGGRGVFGGFRRDLLSRALDLDGGDATTFVRSQTTNGVILKIADDFNVPVFDETNRNDVVTNLIGLVPSVQDAGGAVFVLNSTTDLPLLKEMGCGVSVVCLDQRATYSPTYSRGSTFQIIYISSGGGQFQVVGASGENLLNTTVEAQQLFLVPGSSVISASAGSSGLAWLSMVDTLSPSFVTLAGKGSVLKALSPTIVQAAFAVTSELETVVRAKRSADVFCFPSTPAEEEE